MPHGIAPIDYAEDLAANLSGLSYPGGNIRVGMPTPKARPGNDPTVYVFDTPADNDEDYKDGGAGTGITKPAVQIRIRGRQNDPSGARRLAFRVYDQFRFREIGGYCRGVARSPSDLGVNGDGDPEWSVSVQAWRDVRPRPWYWGLAAPGGLDEAGVNGLANVATADLRFRAFDIIVGAALSLYWCGPSDRNGIGASGLPSILSRGPGQTESSAGAFALVTDALPFITPLGLDTYQVWEAAGLPAGPTSVDVR